MSDMTVRIPIAVLEVYIYKLKSPYILNLDKKPYNLDCSHWPTFFQKNYAIIISCLICKDIQNWMHPHTISETVLRTK